MNKLKSFAAMHVLCILTKMININGLFIILIMNKLKSITVAHVSCVTTFTYWYQTLLFIYLCLTNHSVRYIVFHGVLVFSNTCILYTIRKDFWFRLNRAVVYPSVR